MQLEEKRVPTWVPSDTFANRTRFVNFRQAAEIETGLSFPSTPSLHAWSISEPDDFWSLVWDYFGIRGFKGDSACKKVDLPAAEFFPGSMLNLAQNLLAPWIGSEEPACIFTGESDGKVEVREVLAGHELVRRVGSLSDFLRGQGIKPGDRIGLIMPVGPDALAGLLAALTVGATVSSVSPEFGPPAIIDRLGQLEPSAIIAQTNYTFNGRRYDRTDNLVSTLVGLPSVSMVLIADDETRNQISASVPESCQVLSLTEAMEQNIQPVYEQLPFDHPAYILFSSGTTGKPKCLAHRAGGILVKHLVELGLHADIQQQDHLLFYTTTSWMMWNWEISALALGATVILHDGAPTYPNSLAVFDAAVLAGATHVGVGASLLDNIKADEKRLSHIAESARVRQILATGSPLSVSTADWLSHELGVNVMINPMSGGTDLIGLFVSGDPTRPFFAGEMTGPALGVEVDVYSDLGKPAKDLEQGELVCLSSFPTVPLGIWGDADGSMLRKAYFDVWPGVWVHGDRAVRSTEGGISILGRSDATLNVGGVRIGTAEVYAALAQCKKLKEYLAFGQEYNQDTRIVLLVVTPTSQVLTESDKADIRALIKSTCSPRHVPAVILEVQELPKTQTGKISEIAVREAVHGREVKGSLALANPESLGPIVKLVRGIS